MPLQSVELLDQNVSKIATDSYCETWLAETGERFEELGSLSCAAELNLQ